MGRGGIMMGLMLLHCCFSVVVLVVFCGSSHGHDVSRSDFPRGFIFGTASSAFQYEGAAREDGRGPSIWDTLTLQHQSSIADSSNAIVADDQYHRYKEDINLMSEMGMDAYRFSISWPRILPKGRGSVNQLGVDYYNNLINGLLEKGIQPFVTLYHWDLPQSLQDAYGGWLSPLVIDDFTNFVNICFREFGDRVKHWITFNEPNIFIPFGYNNGTFAPQRCSRYIGDCKSGDSATEPYIVGHNVLLSHARVVDLYRKEYQAKQQGSIGITQSAFWYVALRNSSQDSLAVQRILDFTMGWFVDPIVFGDYPTSMRDRVGDRLPHFTNSQKKMLKSSIDFIGINYYASNYAYEAFSPSNLMEKDYYSDMSVLTTGQRDGVLIGPLAASPWLNIAPFGLYNLMMYVKDKYKKIPIYITENGVDEVSNSSIPLKEALQDPVRMQYYNDHLTYLSQSIRDGADVRGYFAWSLLDNFEWTSGYTVRFGIYFVDFKTLQRYPKASAHWFKVFLTRT